MNNPENPINYRVSDKTWKDQFLKKPFAETMTMRDYFAAKVMQGMMANYEEDKWEDFEEQMANKSYFMADSMLKAREK